MAFYGSTFIYDGIPSEEYNLQIINFETGLQEGISGGASEVIEEYQIHRPKAYFYKRTHNIPLEFEFTIGGCNTRTALDFNAINKWMLGKSNYKKLQIVQNDLADIYWNVIFLNAVPLYVGNMLYAIKYTAHCDSGFAWTLPSKFSYSPPAGQSTNATIGNILIDNAIDDFVYPTINITMNMFGGDIWLVNLKDIAETPGGRSVGFLGLQGNESIYIDNENKIITSSLNNFKYSSLWDGKWFRLINGYNTLFLIGQIANIRIEYQLAKKIGV